MQNVALHLKPCLKHYKGTSQNLAPLRKVHKAAIDSAVFFVTKVEDMDAETKVWRQGRMCQIGCLMVYYGKP